MNRKPEKTKNLSSSAASWHVNKVMNGEVTLFQNCLVLAGFINVVKSVLKIPKDKMINTFRLVIFLTEV